MCTCVDRNTWTDTRLHTPHIPTLSPSPLPGSAFTSRASPRSRMRAASRRTHKDISRNVFLLFVIFSLGTTLSTALLVWGFPLLRFLECGRERNHPDFHANILRQTNTENWSGVRGKTYTQPSPHPSRTSPPRAADTLPLLVAFLAFLRLSEVYCISVDKRLFQKKGTRFHSHKTLACLGRQTCQSTQRMSFLGHLLRGGPADVINSFPTRVRRLQGCPNSPG